MTRVPKFSKHTKTFIMAERPPSPGDLKGFWPGAWWYDTRAKVPYFCLDTSSGGAIWVEAEEEGPVLCAWRQLEAWWFDITFWEGMFFLFMAAFIGLSLAAAFHARTGC